MYRSCVVRTSGVRPSRNGVCFAIRTHMQATPLLRSSKPGPAGGPTRGEVVVITSGKGGVGKTTSAASFSYGLAERGFKVVAIDFDIGLRNLDLHLGMERRVVYDFINVLKNECNLHQALIKDKRNPNLTLLAASQTRDKTALTTEGVEAVMDDLRKQFDFIVCDSPAGIESGAHHAMFFADTAVVCTNPEMSSVRDSDKMLGILASKSKRALENQAPIKVNLLITRYDANKVEDNNMLSVDDILELLGPHIPLMGVIPDSSDEVLKCTNVGKPPITESTNNDVGQAYADSVGRFLGEDIPFKFLQPKPTGFFGNLASVFKKK